MEVVHKAGGRLRGMVFIHERKETSASKSELVCTRQGNVDMVRTLDLPAHIESIYLPPPGNTELMTNL